MASKHSKNKVPYLVQPFDIIVPSLISIIEKRATTDTSITVDKFKVPWLLKCSLSEFPEEQIKVAFRDTGFLPSEAIAPKKLKAVNEFASEKCASCKVRIGISGIHCIICGGIYHEACAVKEKGDTTAICKHCLKA